MNVINRILGEFPIFGESSELGEMSNFAGDRYYGKRPNDFYKLNKGAYEQGEVTLDEKSIKGMFNFITNAIGYLYERGVAEFTLGVKYPRGSVVSLGENLFISLVPDNTHHVSKEEYWKRITLPTVEPEEKGDKGFEYPIGTILTVPVNTKMKGFIDYKAGQKFNKVKYKGLYEALGSDVFAMDWSDISVPVGSIIQVLEGTLVPPVGWVEFKYQVGNLVPYPELKVVLEGMVNNLPIGNLKSIWVSALRQDTFPKLSNTGFFLRGGSTAGNFSEDKVKVKDLELLPAVLDDRLELSRLGMGRGKNCEPVSLVTGGLEVQEGISDVLVVPVMHSFSTGSSNESSRSSSRSMRSTKVNLGDDVRETTPKALEVRFFVKGVKGKSSDIPITHKRIIKV